MLPTPVKPARSQRPGRARQRGASLAIAVFIIVVLSVVGFLMVRVISAASSGVVAEVLGARAQFAAQSGAEIALTELFPHGQTEAVGCGVVSATHQFTGDGLQTCEAEISCTELDATNFVQYRITSTGVCGSGSDVYSREIQVEASDASL